MTRLCHHRAVCQRGSWESIHLRQGERPALLALSGRPPPGTMFLPSK